MVRLRWNVLCVVASALICGSAFGQTAITWVGGGASDDAGDSGNWTGGAPTGVGITYNATFGAWSTFGTVSINQSEVVGAGLSAITLGTVAFTDTTQAYSFIGTSGTPTIDINGTLTTAASEPTITFNSSLDLSLGSGSGPFTLASGSQIVVNSPVGGMGTLTLLGSGTLTLGGAATYSGYTYLEGTSLMQVVSGGSINGGGGLYVGYYMTDNATLAISGGGTVNAYTYAIAGDASGSNGIVTVDGAGSVLNTNSAEAYFGLGGTGTLSVTNHGVVNADYVTFGANGGSTGNGTVSGSGSALNMTGGTLYVGQSGTGTLSVASGGAVGAATTNLGVNGGSTGTITVDGAGSTFSNTFYTYLGYSGAGSISVTNGGSFTSGLTLIVGYNSGSSGALTLSSGGTATIGSGSGILDLYSGAATLNFGAASGSGAAAAGALNAAYIQGIGTNDAVQLNTTASSGAPFTLAPLISGTTQVINTAGYTILSGDNSYTGATIVNGGTLEAGNANAFGYLSPVTTSGMGVLALNGHDIEVGSLSSSSTSSGINLGSNTLTIGGAASTTYGGVISGTSTGNLTVAGTGTQTLTNTNTYTGNTTINGGASLQFGDGTTNGSVASTTIADYGTLVIDENAGGPIAYTIVGSGGVTQNGTVTNTLNGINTYTGPTVVNGGILNAGNSGAFGSLSAVTTSGTGFLALNGNDITVGSLSSSSPSSGINLGSNTLTIGGAASTTYNGVISGSGNLIVAGTGTQILTNTNTYSGTTTINSGALQLGNGTSNGSIASSTGPIVDNGTLIVSGNPGVTVGLNITGTGGVTQSGPYVETLSGDNSYTGPTMVNGGTLQAGSATAFGNGSAVILSGSGVLSLNNFDITVGSISSASASSGISLGTNTLTTGGDNSTTTFAGVITGGMVDGLTEAGSGTLILTGANTYSGATMINCGANLQLGNGSTNGTIASTSGITDNGTLIADEHTAVTISQAINGEGGSLIVGGLGKLTLIADNGFSGATTIYSGANLQLGDGSTNGTISSTSGIADYGTLTLDEACGITLSTQITDGGALVITGPGAVDIEGCNSFSGGATLSGATVTIGTDTGLGSGPVSATNSTLCFTSSSPDLCSPLFSGSTVNFSGNPVLSDLTLFESTLNFNGSCAEIRDMDSDGMGSTNLIHLGSDTDLTIHVSSGNETDYNGTITDCDGSGSLTVTGSGLLDLTSSNGYGGGTTINNGVLIASNCGALGSGMVAVNGCNAVLELDSGVTLANSVCLESGAVAGYGTFSSSSSFNIQGGSIIAGGRGVFGAASGQSDLPVQGLLTFSSCASLTFGGGGIYQFAVANAGGTNPGTDYSSVNVEGTFNLTASSESPFTIEVLSVNPSGLLGTTAFNSSQSYQWTLLTTPSCISCFSPCDFTVDTSQLNGGSVSASQFSVAAMGDNLVLNFTPVPEPSTWALMAGGLCAVGAVAVRRRRSA